MQKNKLGFHSLFYVMIAENVLILLATWAIFTIVPINIDSLHRHTEQVTSYSMEILGTASTDYIASSCSKPAQAINTNGYYQTIIQ